MKTKEEINAIRKAHEICDHFYSQVHIRQINEGRDKTRYTIRYNYTDTNLPSISVFDEMTGLFEPDQKDSNEVSALLDKLNRIENIRLRDYDLYLREILIYVEFPGAENLVNPFPYISI